MDTARVMIKAPVLELRKNRKACIGRCDTASLRQKSGIRTETRTQGNLPHMEIQWFDPRTYVRAGRAGGTDVCDPN